MTTDTPEIVPAGQGDPPEPDLRDGALPALLAVGELPSPRALRGALRRQVDDGVAEYRRTRGAVQLAHDTFPLQRVLCSALDWLGDYRRTIADLERHLRGHIEDEAVEGTGEIEAATVARWNGTAVPGGNVTVPDQDGDWHITRDYDYDVTADWQSLISVQARLTAAHATVGQLDVQTKAGATVDLTDLQTEARSAPDEPSGLSNTELEAVIFAVAQLAAEDTVMRLDALRRKDGVPSSKALEAWGKELARKGLDELSSVVATAWTRRRLYKGVKVEKS